MRVMTAELTALVWLRRLLGVGTTALILSTWPLWGYPPSTLNPHIPWFTVLCHVPFTVDRLALTGVLLGIVGMILPSRPERWASRSCGLFAVSGLVLVLLDQHRLQPWMWHVLVISLLLAVLPNRLGLTYCRWFVISIYVHSAFSKLDASFFESHGQLLLEGLMRPTGIDARFWSPVTRQVLAGLFPMGELAVGLLLLIPRTRRWGLNGSALMHLLLLWTLGPWGLNHEPAVLIWNVLFLMQNFLLFRGPSPARGIAVGPSHVAVGAASPRQEFWTPRPVLGCLVLLVVVLGPLGESCGCWDHWPAWAVYSSRPAQLQVLLEESAVARLPREMQPYLGVPAPLDERVPLRLERWSFTTRRCPLYPQLRYRLALARALLADHVSRDSVTVLIQSTPDRFTGRRTAERLSGVDEMAFDRQHFWVNMEHRR